MERAGEEGERRRGLGYRNGPEQGAFFSFSSISGAAVEVMATQQQHAPCSRVDSRRCVLARCKEGRDIEDLSAGTSACSGRWSPRIKGRRRRRPGPPQPTGDKPGHGKPGPPGPAQKWPGPSGQSMLLGRAWAVKVGPIAESGRAWVDEINIFLKAQPDGPVVFCSVGPGLG
jgi:hypothetical protein